MHLDFETDEGICAQWISVDTQITRMKRIVDCSP